MLDYLREIAARHGASPAQVAIAWVLRRPAVTTVLIGASRKSMFRRLLGREVAERMPASIAAGLAAVARGAAVLRVHDVRETADALRVWTAVASEAPA